MGKIITELKRLKRNNRERSMNWTNVKDELPKEQGHYLVYCPRSFPKNYRGRIAEFYTDNETFYCEWTDSPIEDVTHWIRLPKDPK